MCANTSIANAAIRSFPKANPMQRLSILLGLLLLCATATAGPITPRQAQQAATRFLQQQGHSLNNGQLDLHKTVSCRAADGSAIPCYYVFNYGEEGFVIASADDRCAPIIGYSLHGRYADSLLPTNLAVWLQECAQEIEAGIRDNAPENPHCKKLWAQLLSDKTPETAAPKSESYLLTSTWEQGTGYNKYCPVMNGRHVVVGCVATAMAQIIRYYQYPTRGFGYKAYVHEAYGQLAVDFDTTEYDYSLMPDAVWYGSSDDVIDMVSRLCYHCGVVVSMNYQHAGHTSGSGAQTDKLPEAFRHFGYTDVEYYQRSIVNNDTLWKWMIRNEIDHLRPIEYSGFNDEGGHAFVLDGYNDYDQYHFNWGWGGYGDGFYTLTTMFGYTGNHTMSIHIQPSGWDGHLERFYVSADGDGDGTSWQEANCNLQAAITLNSLVSRDIWLKEGTYCGDSSADYAYRITYPVSIIGGFAGTETAANQRDAKLHPAILDGQGRHGVLLARLSNGNGKYIKLTDITLQNGYSPQGSCIDLSGQVLGNYLVVRHCLSDSGRIATFTDSRVRMSIFEDNQAPTICLLEDATLRQSLLNNNNSDNVLFLNRRSRVVNSDIVCNTGTGVVFNHSRNTFINNIVWNNDSTLRCDVELLDTAIRSCGLESDTNFADSTWVRLGSSNDEGPLFVLPGSRGRAGLTGSEDYRLQRGSRCINAGERLTESIQDGDLDRSIRCRDSYIDLGCYESNYPVGLNPVRAASLRVYPNPATTTITVENCPDGLITLYDMTGRRLFQQRCRGSVSVDLSPWPQGIYYLQAGTSSHKVVRQ